ncbi:S8 family peptidase [Paenactinomyces guangxiensis]|uniref:S8 family peptidase n=1 Tax=Paenactinomyces guangxiensis TaxID=1490290 RepID=A0A7W1WN24_9BACL|nr:S8 family peptidase [Paenactinomyces guangxiensis]MBA4492938.1 S8 family peptidase [Paenactinomyces guangxiensis]MBH8590213.1 S8 family peptidase [Paenactinomyces guangxiensis]
MNLSQWLHHHRRQLDPALISTLTKYEGYLRRIPSFLRHPAEKIAHQFMQISVLVQWEPKKISHFTHVKNPLHECGFSVWQYFTSIHTFSLPISLAQLPALLQIPGVKKVYLDRKIYALLDTAVPATRASVVWPSGNHGENATIAILDTGIAPHPDLQSRIIAFYDLVHRKNKPYDDNGHGTHCAGCAAGDGFSSDGRYCGTAPKASLAGVKVLGRYGEGTMSSLIAGIQWCIRHKEKYNIRVISLSLGSDGNIPYQDDPVCQMVEYAWKKGIVVVAAAGNQGPKAQTICSPGIHPLIITVGATDHQRTACREDDRIAKFSSRGPTADGHIKPDLVAPGTNIISLRSNGSHLDRSIPENRIDKSYFSLSGTSMATPIVAGITALMISANPSLTPDEVKKRLLQTAFSLRTAKNIQGAGQVDAEKAILNK